MESTHNQFKEILRCFREHERRAGSRFAPQRADAIASIVKQHSAWFKPDKSRVSRILQQYRYYFETDWDGHANVYGPIWDRIKEDHPNLLPEEGVGFESAETLALRRGRELLERQNCGNTEPVQSDQTFSLDLFCDEAIKALQDEFKQAEETLMSRPVPVERFTPIGSADDPEAATLVPGTSGIYVADLSYRVDEAPPIPEGVPVRIQWSYGNNEAYATLLQWDLIRGRAFVSFKRELTHWEQQQRAVILVTTHELLKPLAANLEGIRSLEPGPVTRLLSGDEPHLVEASANPGGALDESQLQAVDYALKHDFTLIWGPPGTGKTHTIGALLCDLAVSGKRVLATSISNIAVDNMAIKFVQNLKSTYSTLVDAYENGRYLRFGYTRNDELTKDQYRPLFTVQNEMRELLSQIKAAKAKRSRLGNSDPLSAATLQAIITELETKRNALVKKWISSAHIVFTTATQVYLNDAFVELGGYDAVVVDEASMMAVPALATVAARAKAQVVVVGDFKQLAPIAVSQSEVSRRYLHRSIFEWLGIQDPKGHSSVRMLATQRRMSPAISSWVSSRFYFGSLIDSPDRGHTDDIRLPSHLPSRLVSWDLSQSPHRRYEFIAQHSSSSSRYNLCSAECVTRLALLLAEQNPTKTVAIICTYRAQVYDVRRRLERLSEGNETSISVGTVHTFQGSEADIVIWDTVDTSDQGLGLPYNEDQGNRLTNVAVSRARELLIVACDRRLKNKVSAQTTVGRFMDLLREADSGDVIDGWLKRLPPPFHKTMF